MRVTRDKSRRLLGYARTMRSDATDAERRMWTILRSRKLSGFKFRRQYPIGGYIVDFYCVKARVAIELDGGQHKEPEYVEYDKKRTRKLNGMGVRVIRFSDLDALKDSEVVAETIWRELNSEPSP
jgi:very-short-patch-repair endonuclease